MGCGMRYIILLILLLFVSVSAFAHEDQLTWAPPTLASPNVYTVENISDTVVITKNESTSTTYTKTELISYNLTADEDAIFVLPDYPLELANLKISYGKNIQIIGGEIRATIPANATVRSVLRFGGTAESIYLEGIIIDGQNMDGLDGVLVGSYTSQDPRPDVDVYIQNTIIKGVQNQNGNIYHADCFQYYGETGNTRMDRVSCTTNTQGFFLAPQHEIGAIDLRRVTFNYTDAETANGYALYLRDNTSGRRNQISLQDVYVEHRVTNFGWGNDHIFGVYSIFPHHLVPDPVVENRREIVTFPRYPEIQGEVKRWVDEYFVQDAGINYTQLGNYKGIEPNY